MRNSHAPQALFYLWKTSLWNRLRAQRGRLRQPRYIAALLLGGAYIYWIISMNGTEEGGPFEKLGSSGVGSSIIAALLLVFAARWWLMKPDRSALAFTPAEAHLLFPAPISRRTLVQSKLLRGQIAILANVLIWVILLRGGASTIEGWQRGVALWLLFSTFTLHRLAAALVRVNAEQHQVAGWKRSALPALVFSGMLGTVVLLLWRAHTTIQQAWTTGPGDALRAVHVALDVPIGNFVLAPVQLLIAPLFADSRVDWLLALGPAVLVLLLHYLWVIRTEAAFEEAALEASQERARRLEAMTGKRLSTKRSRAGDVARVLPMPRWGHPAVMMAWKNSAAAIRSGGWLRQLVVVVGFMALILFGFRFTIGVPIQLVLMLTGIWGTMLVLLGPSMLRYDLRLDLRDLTTLRSLPLTGRAIVSAEIVGVSLLHAVSVYAFLAVPFTLIATSADMRATVLAVVPSPSPVVVSALILVPILTLLSFTVQNGLAVLYPTWVQLGTDRRGFEAMGQTMLTTGIMAIASAIALVFPVLVGIAIALLARIWIGGWGPPVGMVAALLVAIGELIPLWMALGSVLDRTEPGDVPGQQS